MKFLVAILGVLALQPHPAQATVTYVSTTFDRSGWAGALGGVVVTDTFSVEIAQADTMNLDSGVTSVATGKIGTPNHLVSGGEFLATLRPVASGSPGYSSITLTFPFPITAFGADFYSIGGSRQVGPGGTFDNGAEHFDLRTIFINAGGLDQGFFGFTSTTPFDTVVLSAPGREHQRQLQGGQPGLRAGDRARALGGLAAVPLVGGSVRPAPRLGGARSLGGPGRAVSLGLASSSFTSPSRNPDTLMRLALGWEVAVSLT